MCTPTNAKLVKLMIITFPTTQSTAVELYLKYMDAQSTMMPLIFNRKNDSKITYHDSTLIQNVFKGANRLVYNNDIYSYPFPYFLIQKEFIRYEKPDLSISAKTMGICLTYWLTLASKSGCFLQWLLITLKGIISSHCKNINCICCESQLWEVYNY